MRAPFSRGGVDVHLAVAKDVPAMAAMEVVAFHGHIDAPEASELWFNCYLRSSPRYQYFVVLVKGVAVGYVGLRFEGGFLRPGGRAVIEVDQIAIHQDYRRFGYGPFLWDEAITRVVSFAIALHIREKRRISKMRVVAWVYRHNWKMRRMVRRCLGGKPRKAGYRNIYGKPEVMYRWTLPVPLPDFRHRSP